MTNRTHTGLFLLVLAAGLAGCDSNSPSPTGPSPVSQQTVPPPAAPPPRGGYGNGYTLNGVGIFGVVSETTPTGEIPIVDVSVYCDACGALGHTWTRTDANGYYNFDGDLDSGGGIWLSTGLVVLLVTKEGYQDPPGLTKRSPKPWWKTISAGTRESEHPRMMANGSWPPASSLRRV